MLMTSDLLCLFIILVTGLPRVNLWEGAFTVTAKPIPQGNPPIQNHGGGGWDCQLGLSQRSWTNRR